MSEYARGQAREKIAQLVGQRLDLVTLWHAATEALAPAVPFYLTPCFYTLDPASLLVTSHYHEGLPAIPHAWLAHEYYGEDVNKLAEVARSARGVATLHEATGGDVGRSARYHLAMEPLGGDQEALVGRGRGRGRSGASWRSTARVGSPSSTRKSWACCASSPPHWRRGPGGPCSSARPRTPSARRRPAWSSCATTGASSR
jgi:hypothetical protein